MHLLTNTMSETSRKGALIMIITLDESSKSLCYLFRHLFNVYRYMVYTHFTNVNGHVGKY